MSRGVEVTSVTANETHLFITCRCDCGFLTECSTPNPPPIMEFSYICDGYQCGAIHWLSYSERYLP